MTSEQIRQKAREYRKQFYAPGTQHVNDSAIEQENMLTGFAESLLSGGVAATSVGLCKHCGLKIYLNRTEHNPKWRHHGSNFVECFGDLETWAEPSTAGAAPPAVSPQPTIQSRAAHTRKVFEHAGGIRRQHSVIVTKNAEELLRAASGSGTPATPSAPDADERLRIISEEKEEFRQDCIALSAQLKAALKEIEREREACAKLADGDKCGRTAEAIRSRASQPGPAQSTGGKTK